MEILTEFDALQEAMKKIKLDESVLPYYNGRLVDDKAYNQIQKILNCPEMVSCHKYLYNLDLDQLNEDEVDKVAKLYKLGCDRGFIIDDLTDWDADDSSIDDATAKITGDAQDKTKPEEKVEEPKSVAGTLFKAKVPCWTIIYSATSKDGEIKTGEAYSNAISAAAAKADVKSKLSNIGYSNITILAIESYEVDADVATVKQDVKQDVTQDDAVEVSEADDDSKEESNEEKESSEEEESSDDSKEESNEESEEEKTTDEESSDDSKEEESNEDTEEEETSDEEPSEESSDDSSSEDSKEDTEEEDSENEESSDDSEEESNEDKDSEDDSDEESDEEKEELDANKKAELKDKYKKTFKNTLVKCKFTKSFNDLTLEEKVKFFTQLSKAWTKNEPNEFMTDKEIEQLNNVVVNPESDDSDED